MITLYAFATPNGHKASIMLEEAGLAYQVRRLELPSGDHLTNAYGKVSPIHKIPAILDDIDGSSHRVFGSGAILLHLAVKTGKLLPPRGVERAESFSWLEFGVSDLGPTAVDLFRFTVRAPEKLPYAIDLFKAEFKRCTDAMEERLAETAFLSGLDYTIADIACFPFIAVAVARPGFFDGYPALQRWHNTIAARPAVQRGIQALA
ncbi:MAG TPA: glutathione S-transferase C-terminal domain-containing protein [Azospirillaceae bacterium]|nr:glutathione S-transferase C-terminal domain-containing protein [Azospirillaceae bacterium]